VHNAIPILQHHEPDHSLATLERWSDYYVYSKANEYALIRARGLLAIVHTSKTEECASCGGDNASVLRHWDAGKPGMVIESRSPYRCRSLYMYSYFSQGSVLLAAPAKLL